MKNSFLYIIIICISMGISTAQAQPKLYIGISGLNDQQKAELTVEKNKVFILYENQFLSKNRKSADLELLTKLINDVIPAKDAFGLGVIDWEGPFKRALINNKDNNERSKAINEYLKVLNLAKKLRPNLEWGYYGLPLRSYQGKTDQWIKDNEGLIRLLRQQDVLFPSLYTFSPSVYRSVIPSHESGTGDYIITNLDYSLQLGAKLGKKVIPFVWERANSSKFKNALKLIPLPEFRNYIHLIATHTYKTSKVDGIIWWGHIKYFYQNRAKFGGILEEYEDVKNVDQYNTGMLKKYYRILNMYFK